MAVNTESLPIIYIKNTFRIFTKWLNVVGFYMSYSIPTVAAFIIITLEYCISPLLISFRIINNISKWCYTSLPEIVCRSTDTLRSKMCRVRYSFLAKYLNPCAKRHLQFNYRTRGSKRYGTRFTMAIPLKYSICSLKPFLMAFSAINSISSIRTTHSHSISELHDGSNWYLKIAS